MPRFDFSARGWGRVILWTVLGTLGCIAVAIYVGSFNFVTLDQAGRTRAILINIFLPLMLAAPMLLFLTSKLRELAIARHQLAIVASKDSLTSVLNRGGFTTLVDAYLNEVREEERSPSGALLVVDADNFKAINDSYGHDWGDEALRIIAHSIAGILRSADLVGRIGGEEFGVFLPESGVPHAEAVAERIRRSVSDAQFVPDGQRRRLSVSVGGAVFERRLLSSELFRVADQQLYAAKHSGRNRIAVSPVSRYDTVPKAAA
ncbi:MAG: GGDEF domain-containing protein [Devosia sp.]